MNHDERDSVSDQFGVSTEQVERDHLISHVLAFLSTHVENRIDFIGGTALARTHLPKGRLTLEPTLSSVASIQPAILRSPSGLSVRVQLPSSHDRTVWPAERRALFQRYADAPAAKLLVPTLPAFAASKTATWTDRLSVSATEALDVVREAWRVVTETPDDQHGAETPDL
ncbi:hypothetical protein [Mycolicibacterium sp. 050158]|uniref:hypothetical protein n=1 Tax=Mycolicibacterium sp. 050158 TaxID=3090602 RepID=UPI00299EECDC|nr:hypothetical protein [Mycolicibacterium sp. 050158]MDX1891228.1 hypothetical protein [Mycolicibacterium sp. 050158]